MIAPTIAIAEIALVSDISGVCSRRETRLMTSMPMNVESMNTNSMVTKSMDQAFPMASRRAARCFGMASYGSGDDSYSSTT